MCVTFLINAIIIKLFPASSSNTAAHWTFVALTWLFNFVFFISSVSPIPGILDKREQN